MLVKYLTFKNLLKFDIWWKTKEKKNLQESCNFMFVWKNINIYSLTPFTFIFSKIMNIFLDYISQKGKVFFYTTLFGDPLLKKEFLVYCSSFYITNIWVRGFLSNFDVLQWKIFIDHQYFLKRKQPGLLINLTNNSIPIEEANSMNIPSISLNSSATYPLFGNSTLNSKYFYITFFFTLLHIFHFKYI